MAIEKVMARRTLGISVKDGMNADGTDKLKTYSYSKLKDTAADALAVGKALGSLMNSEVAEVIVTEKSTLTEVM